MASAEVKITLGSRWVANIGEGLDVLLGMGFMFRKYELMFEKVQLPDEESILMYDEDIQVPQGVTCQLLLQKICISCPENTPSCVSSMDIRIQSEKSSGLDQVGNQDQTRSWPVASKVVKVSKHSVWIDMKTPLARIVQYG
ncbi:LOW QUALITY PROTEIN: hypothetical protein PHMEG_00028402 [Phytophthora megakarya]|uniref:Uncharacterized protein n=1 Tax=Phytophthora megakarya TaxID=4795 RepID=A0A225V622_9STRA|nr:LOW QUALITY PROTEIN: hypothetical protein PHMEG_00028402 [Phytophthora megakarya]